jgi:hypothetical protein
MSFIELQVRSYKNLEQYFTLAADIISIGDEACIYQLPLGEEALGICKMIIQKGYKLKFITPKITDVHFDKVINTLALLQDKGIDYILVVNDLGLLYEGHKKKILPGEVFLGRSVTRSLEDSPWIEEFIEDEEYLEDVLANTLADDLKINCYSKYGVTGIDASLHNHSFLSFKKISEKGWKISCHIGNYAVAFSRKCAYAIYQKSNIGNCMEECNRKIEISLSQTTNDIIFQPCVNKNNSDFTNLFLLGNVLYRKSNRPSCEELKSNQYIYNYVIHDYDFTLPEMEEFINNIRLKEGPL